MKETNINISFINPFNSINNNKAPICCENNLLTYREEGNFPVKYEVRQTQKEKRVHILWPEKSSPIITNVS